MTLSPTPGATAPKLTLLEQVNAYAKHAVSVAAGVAIAEGILDPATGAIHISGAHALYAILLATGASLVMSYAGLGAPSAPKTVLVAYPPPIGPPVA